MEQSGKHLTPWAPSRQNPAADGSSPARQPHEGLLRASHCAMCGPWWLGGITVGTGRRTAREWADDLSDRSCDCSATVSLMWAWDGATRRTPSGNGCGRSCRPATGTVTGGRSTGRRPTGSCIEYGPALDDVTRPNGSIVDDRLRAGSGTPFRRRPTAGPSCAKLTRRTATRLRRRAPARSGPPSNGPASDSRTPEQSPPARTRRGYVYVGHSNRRGAPGHLAQSMIDGAAPRSYPRNDSRTCLSVLSVFVSTNLR
jgi:hypothetical protein